MLELRLVDESNEVEVGSLAVRNSQKMFIDSNIMSIAMAKKNPKVLVPLGIYVNGRAVGFALLAFDENCSINENRYWLVRFMIDQGYQGLGYGKAALNEVLGYFNAHCADRVKLSTSPANTIALSLFHEFGFRETGERNDSEIILKRFL